VQLMPTANKDDDDGHAHSRNSSTMIHKSAKQARKKHKWASQYQFFDIIGIHSLGHELYDAPAPNMADINFSISLGFIPWAMNSTTPQPDQIPASPLTWPISIFRYHWDSFPGPWTLQRPSQPEGNGQVLPKVSY
jgi:hypothetical protein